MRGARFLGGLGLIFVSAACFEPTAPSRQGLAGGGGGSGEPVLTFTIQPSTVFVDAPMTVEIT
ncbi:MAG: hypothetical protein ACREA0_31020, partial [bacterium]